MRFRIGRGRMPESKMGLAAKGGRKDLNQRGPQGMSTVRQSPWEGFRKTMKKLALLAGLGGILATGAFAQATDTATATITVTINKYINVTAGPSAPTGPQVNTGTHS